MSNRPVEIYRADNAVVANMLVNLLESQGVSARLEGENTQIAGGALPLGWSSAPRVVVAEQDADRARRIAADFDRQISRPLENDPLEAFPHAGESADPFGDNADWQEWPRCPQCSAKRRMQCSLCGAVRLKFPLVDREPGEGPTQVLMHCPDCEEHFRPLFWRRCTDCDYDFGDGVATAAGDQAAEYGQGLRIWLALGLLGVCLLVLGGFFYRVFQPAIVR